LGAEDIIPIIPALYCNIRAAIEAQTADRLSTFTHDDIILGTFVIDDVVNVRDVRDVPSLTDHGDRFARREEHGGKTGSTKLANLDERVVSGTDIIIAVRPSLNPYLVAEVCLGR
jgi:seryl-tRNA(Sec) selenium transferase